MDVVDEIKSRLDILDVVSQYVPLQRAGRSYRALCPFHTEKTPSMHVFPERQSWRCFGACATGGDLFSFVMRVDNIGFSEALSRLGRQAGVELPEKGARKGQHDILYEANELAKEFFCRLLSSDEPGRSSRGYLESRGLTADTIDRFQIGLSPPDGEALKVYLTSRKGYTEGQLAQAGLVTQTQGNRYRDMFRHRLMFPIRDAEGRLAGFGGRTLDGSQPKYLNSPRSPIFDKGHILYALHMAKDAITKEGAVIVEGYMDAIAAHQHGFSNVVASMGTALTQQQVSLIRRLVGREGPTSSEVVLALDPDAAGREATLRSLESSWNVFQASTPRRVQGVTTVYERQQTPSLKIALLPEGKDPGEMIMESPAEWATIVRDAAPLMDYLFSALSSRFDPTTPEGKARLADLLFPLVAATPDPFQQDYYFQRLAALLGVNEQTLQASLGRSHSRGQKARAGAPQRQLGSPQRSPRRDEATSTPFAKLDHDPLEEYCLALMLQNPHLSEPTKSGESVSETHRDQGNDKRNDVIAGGAGVRLEYFRRPENREVFTNWTKCSTLEALDKILDDELKGQLEYLLAKALPPSDRNQLHEAFHGCVRRLEERYVRDLKKEEGLRLSEATAEEIEETGSQILELNQRLKLILNK